MGWTIWVLGFDSWWGLGIFLFTTMSRMAVGPTQPPIQLVPGALSLGVMHPGHEADHSLPYSAKVRNAWSYTSTPQYIFTAWCLFKHRDNFTFYLYLYMKWGLSLTQLFKNIILPLKHLSVTTKLLRSEEHLTLYL
jgi:hypothetical protein